MLTLNDTDIFPQLDRMDSSQLDALSFGVIRMDLDGKVTGYNLVEAALSGLSAQQVLGKNFFNQVAPCTNNYLVAHRFQEEQNLDATIDYVFTLKMRPTKVVLRLLKQSESKQQYVLVAKRT